MKKYLKFLAIISCLVVTVNNSNASSFARRMRIGSSAAVFSGAIMYNYCNPVVVPIVAPQDCGCNACPNTLANKPLSSAESEYAWQEFIKSNPCLNAKQMNFSQTNQMTPLQWYNVVKEEFGKQIVPPYEQSAHMKKVDDLLSNMLPEIRYNSLVEAGIHCPLTRFQLRALEIIATPD